MKELHIVKKVSVQDYEVSLAIGLKVCLGDSSYFTNVSTAYSTNPADLTFTLPVAPTVNNQALISTTAGVMAFTPYTFPTSDGTASQVLQTNGSGVLSFSSVSSDFVLLATSTATGTASSLSLDGYFSSTYRNYELIWSDVYASNDGDMIFRLRRRLC